MNNAITAVDPENYRGGTFVRRSGWTRATAGGGLMKRGPETESLDLVIARVLLGKPDITPSLLRRIIPNLQDVDDRSLGKKIERIRARYGRRPRLLH